MSKYTNYYEFGDCRIDVKTGELRINKTLIPLTPKTFDLLLELVKRQGELVSKEQIVKIVWKKSHTGENSLARNISTLRKKLGDDKDKPIYIETIPTRGYRFIASVKAIEDIQAESDERPEYNQSTLQVNTLPESILFPISALHQIPPPPADFTNREELIDKIVYKVKHCAIKLLAITGMGGVGKTAFALALSKSVKQYYPDAQLYLDLKGTVELQPTSQAQIMSYVINSFYPQAKIQHDFDSIRGHYFTVLEGKRVLLILDNVSDAEQISLAVPPENCLMIITSRNSFMLPGLQIENLEGLSTKHARELFMKIADHVSEQDAEDICKLCGCLPLAIRAAASLLATMPDLLPSNFVKRLTKERNKLIEIGKGKKDLDLEATINLSYEKLDSKSSRLFRLISLFPTTFTSDAVKIICDVEDENYLSHLVQRSLVLYNKTESRFKMHELMRIFANVKLPSEETTTFRKRHASYYIDVLGKTNESYLQGGGNLKFGIQLFDTEWANIESGQAWASENSDRDVDAAKLCCNYPKIGIHILLFRLQPEKYIIWLNAALTVARKLQDRDAECSHLGNLGNTHYLLNQYAEAVKYYSEQLKIAKRSNNRLEEGHALGGLGLVHMSVKEINEAIEYFRKSLEIKNELNDKRGKGQDLGNLGLAYMELGQLNESLGFIERHLQIAIDIGDKRSEGNAQYKLGKINSLLNKNEEALECLEKGIIIADEIGDLRGKGIRLLKKAKILLFIDERSKAKEVANLALEVLKQINHPFIKDATGLLERIENE